MASQPAGASMSGWRVQRPGPIASRPLARIRTAVPEPQPCELLVLPACQALDAGGTLAIAGIHLSDVPPLNYQRHLFREHQIRSVTSNTRPDARAFLDFAAEHHIDVTTPQYSLGDADRALADLGAGPIAGAAVLMV